VPEPVSERRLLSPKITGSHVKYQASIGFSENSSSRNRFVERAFLPLGLGYQGHSGNVVNFQPIQSYMDSEIFTALTGQKCMPWHKMCLQSFKDNR
jgi:hypothetical protein